MLLILRLVLFQITKKTCLAFHFKLVGSDNKLIKFAEGEKKFPIFEFIIEFVK